MNINEYALRGAGLKLESSLHHPRCSCPCGFVDCAQNFITRDDIVMYAEEGGDFAQLKEVDACMQVCVCMHVCVSVCTVLLVGWLYP